MLANSFAAQRLFRRPVPADAHYIARAATLCQELALPDVFPVPSVFNDTSLHFFQPDSAPPELWVSCPEPPSLEDPELVA